MICGLTSSPVNSDDAKSLRAIWVLISQWKQPPSSSEQQIKVSFELATTELV